MRQRLAADGAARCIFVSQDPSKTMRELCARARTANDVHEFLNAVSKKDRENFGLIQDKYWEVGAVTAFQWLSRCEFRTESTPSLEDAIANHGRYLLIGDTDIYEALSGYLVGNFNNHITTEVSRRWIRDESPFSFRPAALDQTLPEAVDAANARYLQSYTPIGFGGQQISRPETREALSALRAVDGPSLVLLTGAAGCGKSGVVREIMTELDARQMSYLTFRIDRYLSRETRAEIGSVLLDRAESPVSVLASLDEDGPTVLIVDQIDAISETSGRTGAIKDVLFELVKETQHYGDVRCLLVCRTFDLDNDPQYRNLEEKHKAKTIQLPNLSWEDDVAPVLQQAGFAANEFNDSQRKLLTLPINLAIFLQISDPTLVFDSGTDLMKAFLEKKVRGLQARHDLHWSLLDPLTAMANWMSDKQELSCPETVLDRFNGARNWLASEGLITVEDHRLAFFHESFFDFVFARTFAASDQDIAEFLTSSEQYLFRRTQVRQILSQMRDVERNRYLGSLETVLTHSTIRLHIKLSVAQWLASIEDPTLEELRVIQQLDSRGTIPSRLLRRLHTTLRAIFRLADGGDPYPLLMRRALFITVSWFDLLNHGGEFASAFNAASLQRQRTLLWWFGRIADKRPQPIATLLRDWWDNDLARNRQLIDWFRTLQGLPVDSSLAVLLKDLVRTAPDNLFPQRDQISILRLLPGLCRSEPETTSEILQAMLEGYFEHNPGKHPFRHDLTARLDTPNLTEIAHEAPSVFLDGMIPALVNSIETVTAQGASDRIYVLYQTRHGGGPSALFSLYRDAFCALAKSAPLAAELQLDKLDPALHEVLLHLHLETIAANPAALGHRLGSLLHSPRLFDAGLENAQWKSFAQAARSVIEAQVVPARVIERTVFQHRPELDQAVRLSQDSRSTDDPERCSTRRSVMYLLQHSGYIQWCVLHTIGPDVLSPAGKSRLQELERKFPGEDVPAPKVYEAVRLGSSIPDPAAAKMSDDQWLAAIDKFEHQRNGADDPKTIQFGEASALAQQLQTASKSDPDRFAHFFFRLPATAHPQYGQHVLQGLANADEPDVGTLVAVLNAAHAHPGRPFGLQIIRIIENHLDCAEDEHVFQSMLWYAEHGDTAESLVSDSSLVEPRAFPSINQLAQSNSHLVVNGSNCARGLAWTVLSRLIDRSSDCVSQIWALTERRAGEETSGPVRAMIPYVLIPLSALDTHRFESCLRALLHLNTRKQDIVSSCAPLTTDVGIQLLFLIERDLPRLARQLIRRMIRSRNPDLALIGAWWSMVERLRTGYSKRQYPRIHLRSPAHAALWASILADLATVTEFRTMAKAALNRLFFHKTREVRQAAASVFQNIPSDEFVYFIDVAQTFIRSPAFREAPVSIVQSLEHAPCDVTALVLDAAERLVRAQQPDASPSIFAIHQILQREYVNSLQYPDMQTRFLDLLDEMAARNFPEADELMQLADRSSM